MRTRAVVSTLKPSVQPRGFRRRSPSTYSPIHPYSARSDTSARRLQEERSCSLVTSASVELVQTLYWILGVIKGTGPQFIFQLPLVLSCHVVICGLQPQMYTVHTDEFTLKVLTDLHAHTYMWVCGSVCVRCGVLSNRIPTILFKMVSLID